MPDPIEMLMQDHREVEQLFADYQQSHDQAIVETICTELTVHAAAEEQVIYPALGAYVPDGERMRHHAEEEHQEVKDAIFEIQRLGYADPGIERIMQTIITNVTEHVEEEETDVFSKMRESLTAEQMETLGDELDASKQRLLSEADTAGALVDLTKEQLYELAQQKGIDGRADMTKDELVATLRQA